MTCLYCKGDMEETTTTHVVEIGEYVIIVKHVPCCKCKKCGEIVYTGSVVKRLEQITTEIEKTLTKDEIVNYSAA